MSGLSDNKIILVIDRDSKLADALKNDLFTHEITHAKTRMEANIVYREIVDAGRQMNLIVLLTIGADDMTWTGFMESLFDISIQPNIIILDSSPDIQKAVQAYSHMAYHYHDKTQVIPADIETWISEIKANPISPIKLDKAFYKDNAWSRHMKDRHEMIALSKLGGQFEETLKTIHEQGSKKPDAEQTLMERATQSYFSKKLNLETCQKLIEAAIGQNMSQLKKPNLLVIEDEPDIRNVIVRSLTQYFDITQAETGEQAIEIVTQNPNLHLALMDIYLPDIKGTELYPKIRNLNDLIVLVALTAFKDISLAEQIIRQGAFGFLNKPFQHIEVTQTLSRAWNRKIWPFFEGKLDVQKLSFIQRLFFFDHLLNERNEYKQLLASPEFEPQAYSKYQLNSMLTEVYNFDIYGLFPELLVDPDLID
jgi:CheY-like chemotaxis protein